MEFDGFNPALNRFLRKYGFVEHSRGEGAPSFNVLDLKEGTPEVKELN
ncbi:MAG: hypothetical protein LBP53_04955 [Candidatus Peribacteria bacterium]|nr:hypothetical protein [Candidatus Peribacteria bacterium]